MTEERTNAALEKLNRGIQDSRQTAQLQAMGLAQDYFGDSVEELKERVDESRAVLKDLPDQVPGGQEEAFQALFQELMDNYTHVKESLEEARKNVAELDREQLRRQGEVEASDAARRKARELGLDLTQIEGTGSDGRIVVDDVKNVAEATENGAAQQTQEAAEQVAGQTQEAAGGAAQQAQDTAGQAAGQAQQAAGQAAGQAQQVAGQARDAVGGLTGGGPLGGVTDQVGQVAQGAQDTAGQAAGQAQQAAGQAGGSARGVNASDAARRIAEERGIDLTQIEGTGSDGRIVYWDVAELEGEPEGGANPAEQLKDQAGGAAGQATDQAGQVAGQAGNAAAQVAGQADGAVGQAGGTASQIAEQAISTAQGTAQQATDQAGQTAQSAGNVAAQAGQSNGTQGGEEGPKATKAARRRAEKMGIDLSTVKGTGSGGLITINDVTGA